MTKKSVSGFAQVLALVCSVYNKDRLRGAPWSASFNPDIPFSESVSARGSQKNESMGGTNILNGSRPPGNRSKSRKFAK